MTRVASNALSTAGATQAFPASNLCTEHGKHHSIATSGASVLPVSRRQSDVSTDGDLAHQYDRAGPEDSHGCKLGRRRMRVVGFWIRLDVLPNQLCQGHPFTAATCKPVRDKLDTDLRMGNHLL